MTDHPFLNHPDAYRLDPESHRYHLILPPVRIPAGGIADELHDRVGKAFAGVRGHAGIVEAIASRQDPKQVSRLIQYNEDAASRVTGLRNRYGAHIDPDAYVRGHDRIHNFLPVLAQHILDGEHGEHAAVKVGLRKLQIEHLGVAHDNASFYRVHAAAPADGKHTLQFGGMTVMAHTNGAKAHDPNSDFFGNAHLLTPELLSLHEGGHLLDYLLGNALHPTARPHDPVHARQGMKPGYRMVAGFDWAHVHDGMLAHTRDSGHPTRGLPTLPGPFARLHYPTHGGAEPHELPQHANPRAPLGHPERAMAEKRQSSLSEWPTVTTEMRAADPSALAALDILFGSDARGRKAHQIVDDFWGFPMKPEADPARARWMADVLGQTLRKGGLERGFQPVEEAGYLLHPNPRLPR